jgi:hypothetical protein
MTIDGSSSEIFFQSQFMDNIQHGPSAPAPGDQHQYQHQVTQLTVDVLVVHDDIIHLGPNTPNPPTPALVPQHRVQALVFTLQTGMAAI